jgi:hypothetical protein
MPSTRMPFVARTFGAHRSRGGVRGGRNPAELIQRIPEVVEPLRDGRICITSIIELAKVVTPENLQEVLPRFFNCSRQEAKAVSAELSPAEAAPHRTVVTAMTLAMPARSDVVRASVERVQPVELPAVERPSPCLQGPGVAASRVSLAPMPAQPVAPRAVAEAILEAGLDLLIERHAKRRGICTRPKAEKPRGVVERGETQDIPAKASQSGDLSSSARAASRHIPAHVKREVWLRDGGRCQFRLENGELCGSSHRLQFDHIRPVALGGESAPRTRKRRPLASSPIVAASNAGTPPPRGDVTTGEAARRERFPTPPRPQGVRFGATSSSPEPARGAPSPEPPWRAPPSSARLEGPRAGAP